MARILFVPTNDIIVNMFAALAPELETGGHRHLTLSIDRYTHEDAEKALDEAGMPFKAVDSFKTRDMKRILKKIKPDIVIFGNDISPLTLIMIDACGAQKIPTLLIQDAVKLGTANVETFNFIRRSIMDIRYRLMEFGWGFGSNSLGIMFGALARKIFLGHDYGHGGCDFIAVYGKTQMKTLIGQGIKKKNIIITGQPKYDIVVNSEKWERKPEDAIVIGYTTQPFVEIGMATSGQRRGFVSEIVRGIRKIKGARLEIKTHPRESPDEYGGILKSLGPGSEKISSETDILKFIHGCDIIITGHSTTGLEGMILKKPVVFMNFLPCSSPEAIFSGSGSIVVEKPEELAGEIEKLIKNENHRNRVIEKQNQFVLGQLHKMDGLASRRIIDLIGSITEENT